MSGAGPQEKHNPTRGWGVIPMILLVLVVLVCLGFFVARIGGL